MTSPRPRIQAGELLEAERDVGADRRRGLGQDLRVQLVPLRAVAQDGRGVRGATTEARPGWDHLAQADLEADLLGQHRQRRVRDQVVVVVGHALGRGTADREPDSFGTGLDGQPVSGRVD
jgi:hypothetical protein